jgi:hypothetical protein
MGYGANLAKTENGYLVVFAQEQEELARLGLVLGENEYSLSVVVKGEEVLAATLEFEGQEGTLTIDASGEVVVASLLENSFGVTYTSQGVELGHLLINNEDTFTIDFFTTDLVEATLELGNNKLEVNVEYYEYDELEEELESHLVRFVATKGNKVPATNRVSELSAMPITMFAPYVEMLIPMIPDYVSSLIENIINGGNKEPQKEGSFYLESMWVETEEEGYESEELDNLVSELRDLFMDTALVINDGQYSIYFGDNEYEGALEGEETHLSDGQREYVIMDYKGSDSYQIIVRFYGEDGLQAATITLLFELPHEDEPEEVITCIPNGTYEYSGVGYSYFEDLTDAEEKALIGYRDGYNGLFEDSTIKVVDGNVSLSYGKGQLTSLEQYDEEFNEYYFVVTIDGNDVQFRYVGTGTIYGEIPFMYNGEHIGDLDLQFNVQE